MRAAWLLSVIVGLMTWLICLAQPFGWRWGLRRFVGGAIAVTAAVLLGWDAMYDDIGAQGRWMGLGSLTLAAMLAVPTLGRRASDTEGVG